MQTIRWVWVSLIRIATKGEKADPQDPQSQEIPWGSKGSKKNPRDPAGIRKSHGDPRDPIKIPKIHRGSKNNTAISEVRYVVLRSTTKL